MVLAGCDEETPEGEACELIAGDLAISELMTDPAGEDAGREWIEIYNVSARVQVLDRLTVQRLKRGDAGVDVAADHVVRNAPKLQPSAYFVMGDGAVGVAPIDYSYSVEGDKLGALTNSIGGVRLLCRGSEIDTVWYGTEGGAPTPAAGRSIAFDGGVAPDAMLNDRGEMWCSGGEVYDGVNLGSPGQPNMACGLAACDEGGTLRDVVAPTPGDLIVTELLADPAGTDTPKEWVEIYVAAIHPVDVNGLVVSSSNTNGTTRTARIQSLACARVMPGEYVVIGASADTELNGNVEVDWVAEGLSLLGDAGVVQLRHGSTLVDSAAVPAAGSGVSTSLDPAALSPTGNDAPDAFCGAKTTGVFEGTGTPGLANDMCGATCIDGGTPRLLVPPVAGDLVLTEVLPDPGANAANPTGADNKREWIELYVASGPVDLNGLQIVNVLSSPRTKVVTSADCVSVEQGSYVVIADPAAEADGVSVSVPLIGFELYNGTASTPLPSVSLTLGGVTLDAVTYPVSIQGSSYQLTAGVLDSVLNDDLASWCVATTPYAPPSDNGSPGAANEACAP